MNNVSEYKDVSIRLRGLDAEEFKELQEAFPNLTNVEILRKIVKYYKTTSPFWRGYHKKEKGTG